MISVAMASYNGEKYIYDQIMSILNQTVQIDELIICDDNSTDNTVKEVKRIDDHRIKLYVNSQNLGYINNFHKAVGLTKGDLVFLADQDDIWINTKVEKMTKIMKDKSCEALCSNFVLIDANGEEIHYKEQFNTNSFIDDAKKYLERITFRRLVFGNIAQGCTYCISGKVRDTYAEISNSQVVHDYQIMLIAASIGDVYFVNENLIKYRLHGNNSIGFTKKERKFIFEKKKPKKRPMMVEFIDDMSAVTKVRWKQFYKVLYYLRIPYIRAIISRLFLGK